MADGSNLSNEQCLAIAALLGATSIHVAANEAGVTSECLRQWLDQPDFRQAYLAARRQAISEAIDELYVEAPNLADGMQQRPLRPRRDSSARRLPKAVEPSDPALDAQPSNQEPPLGWPPREPWPVSPRELSFHRAMTILSEAEGTDAVADLAVAFARRYWRRVMLLARRGAALQVWAARGEGMGTLVVPFALPLTSGSVFAEVVETGRVFMGSLSTHEPSNLLLESIGEVQAPQAVFIYPVAIGGKVACLLYGDSGSGEHEEVDLSELYRLGEALCGTLERLVRRRKQPLG